MEGNAEYPLHRHPNYEIILIERGLYACELNGKEVNLESGQILVIKPGDIHQDHLREGQRHFVVQFRLVNPEPGAPVAPLFCEEVSPLQQICSGDYSHEQLLLHELRRESSNGDIYSGAVQDSLLEALFWRIVRGFEPEVVSRELRRLPQTEVKREQMILVFTSFITKNPNVGEIAESLQMSPRSLVSACQKYFSETPAKLLLRFKLRRADELLNFKCMRVQEVSDELGFSNPYHFSRVYRRFRGRAPSDLKGLLGSRTESYERSAVRKLA
jgi:AraC-like DNA-binding protein